MKKALLITSLSFLLVGCNPQSAEELRRQHDQHRSFEIAAPYETVYRRVHEKARLNFYKGFMGSRCRVEHALFKQRETANVSMFVETHTRNTMLLTIDISRIGENRCRVDVYRVNDAFAEKYAGEIPNWAATD